MDTHKKMDPFTSADGVHDQFISFDEDHHSGKQDTLIIKREQWIPEWYLDDLKEKRIVTNTQRMGDFFHVCSIPVTVYERWLREGYDASKEPVQKTIDRLKKEDLDKFLATTKRLGQSGPRSVL